MILCQSYNLDGMYFRPLRFINSVITDNETISETPISQIIVRNYMDTIKCVNHSDETAQFYSACNSKC